MKILSIIIPIYNLEEYLSLCIESILKQSHDFNDIEIILVNDGSSDNSAKIADEYASTYAFIHTVHQHNQGVSIARNNGLLQAQGEYIWFVDGDDWLFDDSTLTELLNIIYQSCDSDVIFFNILYAFQNINTRKSLAPASLDSQSFKADLRQLLTQNIVMSHPCDKLVKKNLLIEHAIEFPEGLAVAEDFHWNYQLLKYANTYIYSDKCFYTYRRNRSYSASTSLNEQKLYSIYNTLHGVIQQITNTVAKESYSKKFIQDCLLFSSGVWFHILPETLIFNSEERRRVYSALNMLLQCYLNFNVPLEKYNRGAMILEKLVNALGINLGFYVYSRLILFRRSSVGNYFFSKFIN